MTGQVLPVVQWSTLCTLFQPARYNDRYPLFPSYHRPPPMTDYDSPWKEMLENYFQAFMAFFFPVAHRDIDWERGYESLDKELQQIVRDAELGKRLADKLMKVWRRGGEEQRVMIHTEVEGDPKEDFGKRMYVYNYRLFDRYDRPVVSLAVLSDTRRNRRPDRYGYHLWGCEVGIKFPVVKLRDYRQQFRASCLF